jgi:hypothetical protein
MNGKGVHMNRITKIKPSHLLGSILLTALTTASAIGCGAAADGETTGGVADESGLQGAASTGAGMPANAAADDGEKGLRREFCCAVKSGNYVEFCQNLFLTKAGGVLTCSPGDNVLRDGKCDQYRSCDDKTIN